MLESPESPESHELLTQRSCHQRPVVFPNEDIYISSSLSRKSSNQIPHVGDSFSAYKKSFVLKPNCDLLYNSSVANRFTITFLAFIYEEFSHS